MISHVVFANRHDKKLVEIIPSQNGFFEHLQFQLLFPEVGLGVRSNVVRPENTYLTL